MQRNVQSTWRLHLKIARSATHRNRMFNGKSIFISGDADSFDKRHTKTIFARNDRAAE
jgi:hypothetical protein